MLRILYLGAKKHRITIENAEIIYNDIIAYDGIDLVCDMLSVNLDEYDLLIATPPCNYYSRANAYWKTSKVALATKHLLPEILDKFINSGKPFIIENTWSYRCPIDTRAWIFYYGSHIFYSNQFLCMGLLPPYVYQGIKNKCYGNRDDNINVHRVIELFLLSNGVILSYAKLNEKN